MNCCNSYCVFSLGPSREGGLFKFCTGFVVSFSFSLFRLRFQISDFRQSVIVDQICWYRMGGRMGLTLTLDVGQCSMVLRNTLRHCATLSNSKFNLLQSMKYMQYRVNWMHGRRQRTFACKSQKCLWQDWYIFL